MRQGYYGKEPFDLRLTFLCILRRLGLIAAVTLAGTLLFGGGYFIKNVLLRKAPDYSATSVYRVEFAVAEEKDVSTVHINEMTWNTYVDTQRFQDAVRSYLPEELQLTDNELAEALDAVLASNLKVLSTVVITKSPQESLQIAEAVEKVMVQDFPDDISEITSISVLDHARVAEEVYPDVRPVRALVLSALLSFFSVVVILLLKELGDDSIWLPSSLSSRYGLKVLGTLNSPVLIENICYIFRDKRKVALCPVQESIDPTQVVEELHKLCQGTEVPGEASEWFSAPSPFLCPESCGVMREADGILLAVEAGPHAGKQLETVLEYLRGQDCEITGVIFLAADEWLLRLYYGFRKKV